MGKSESTNHLNIIPHKYDIGDIVYTCYSRFNEYSIVSGYVTGIDASNMIHSIKNNYEVVEEYEYHVAHSGITFPESECFATMDDLSAYAHKNEFDLVHYDDDPIF